MLDGELTAAGSGWIISARLVEAPAGNALASFRETARNAEELIDAVDRLSRAVRRKVGESLARVRETKPLADVTTSSLEALRLYSTAAPLPAEEAVPLLEEAIRLDTTFAMGYRRLAALSAQQQRFQRSAELALAAYRHRDRLSERERLMTVGYYHMTRWDNPQALAAYSTLCHIETHQLPLTRLNNVPLQCTRFSLLGERGVEAGLRLMRINRGAARPLHTVQNCSWTMSGRQWFRSWKLVFPVAIWTTTNGSKTNSRTYSLSSSCFNSSGIPA